MTWAPINFLKILNDSKDLIKCFTGEAAASNYGFGICEVASQSPALWLETQAVIIALSEHNTLLLPSYTLLCELVCPQPSVLSAEALIKGKNTLNIEKNSCRWSCKALWKCKLYVGRPWISKNYKGAATGSRSQSATGSRTCRKGLWPAMVWMGCHCCSLLPGSIHWGTNSTSACP